MCTGEILFYIGIGLMACTLVGGIIASVVFTVSGRRIKSQLEKEYGKRPR